MQVVGIRPIPLSPSCNPHRIERMPLVQRTAKFKAVEAFVLGLASGIAGCIAAGFAGVWYVHYLFRNRDFEPSHQKWLWLVQWVVFVLPLITPGAILLCARSMRIGFFTLGFLVTMLGLFGLVCFAWILGWPGGSGR